MNEKKYINENKKKLKHRLLSVLCYYYNIACFILQYMLEDTRIIVQQTAMSVDESR